MECPENTQGKLYLNSFNLFLVIFCLQYRSYTNSCDCLHKALFCVNLLLTSNKKFLFFHHTKFFSFEVLTVIVRTNWKIPLVLMSTTKKKINVSRYTETKVELHWRYFEISYISFRTKLSSCEKQNFVKL